MLIIKIIFLFFAVLETIVCLGRLYNRQTVDAFHLIIWAASITGLIALLGLL